MFDRIARLGRETALYGLSTVLGRMLNFLLVPLYANALSPSENGVVATLYAYVAFAAVVYGFGMEQAFMRFWAESAEPRRPRVLRTSMLGVLPGALFSIILFFDGDGAAGFLDFAPADVPLLRLAAVILLLDSAAAVPFALLRMERRPLSFAVLKSLNILLTLLLTYYFLFFKQAGIIGVIQANVIASAVTLGGVMIATRGEWRGGEDGAHFDVRQLKELLRFGLPLVPAGLAGIALQVIDRPIVKALTDDATVGIYQVNVRLGILMMLAVGMFDFAWRPFFLQHARDPDARALFARIFTYFMSLLGLMFVLVSFFVSDIVRFPVGGGTFVPSVYWEGTEIVPVVLVGYACTGAYVVFLTGSYIEKKTGIIPVMSGISAILTVAGNFLLVPVIGIMGAAVASLAGRLFQAAWMYVEGRRRMAIPYEWRRIGALCVWTVAVYLILEFSDPTPLTVSGLAVKGGMVLVYLAGLFLFRVLRASEFRSVITAGH